MTPESTEKPESIRIIFNSWGWLFQRCSKYQLCSI